RAHGRFQDLEQGDAASTFHGNQTLGNEEAEARGEARSHGLLVTRFEGADDAIDRLGGVDGVERGEDEVTGFRRGQRYLDGFAIAHLADQDDLRRLAQRRPQRRREGRRVAVQLPLVHRRLLVLVQKLDWIFN